VWGYRPEVYYWSGLTPASKFLSTQPLTGVPADIHFFPGEQIRIISDQDTARARAELVSELERVRPKYIIDELGNFNRLFSITSFPELRDFMSGYRYLTRVERFTVYRSRAFPRKKHERKRRKLEQASSLK
jgi:hypothetical protein